MKGGNNYRRLTWEAKRAKRRSETKAGGSLKSLKRRMTKPSKADMRAVANNLLAAATVITRAFECSSCDLRFNAQEAMVPTEPMSCPNCGRQV